MSEQNEADSSARPNPLIWIALIVIGLIVFVFASGDRGNSDPADASVQNQQVASLRNSETTGSIERSLLVPPGMRARQYVEQLREAGKPYPLDEVFTRAQQYLRDGSLADAHLLYFFAAREDHLPAIMQMGEMSDPTLFQAENSLLDYADVIQAYKWYQTAAELGQQGASARLEGLQLWASDPAQAENPHARQLLLNFR